MSNQIWPPTDILFENRAIFLYRPKLCRPHMFIVTSVLSVLAAMATETIFGHPVWPHHGVS